MAVVRRNAGPLGAIGGSLAGGAAGGLPGAIAGAGLGRLLAGSGLGGETIGEATGAAAGEALLEGATGPISRIATSLRKAAPKLVATVLKPTDAMARGFPGATTTRLTGKKLALAQNLLDEGLSVSQQGLNRADDLNRTIRQERKNLLHANATGPVRRMGRPANIVQRLDERIDEAKTALNSADEVSELQRARQSVLDDPRFGEVTPAGPRFRDRVPLLTIEDAKVATGRRLRGKFGNATVSPTRIEADKALRGGAADEISRVLPDTAPSALREAKLISTTEAIDNALTRSDTRDLFGLIPLITIAGGHPKALAAYLANRGASGLGRAAYRTGTTLPDNLHLANAIRAEMIRQMEQRAPVTERP